MKSKHEILLQLLSDESFVRWIKGEATPDEKKNWDKWVNKNTLHWDWAQKAQNLYQLPFYQLKEEDRYTQLQKLQKNIDRYESEKVHNWQQKIGLDNRRKWIAYAAVASIMFIALIFFYQKNYTKKASPIHYKMVHNGYGHKDSLMIRDGSIIILNANSILRYNPETIADSDTKIFLKGEAYFSIMHNSDRTLQVITEDGIIEDIGTKFNVNTRDEITRVALSEGKIKILKENFKLDTTISYSAKPGEFIQLSSKFDKIKVKRENLEVYTSWINNKMVFDDTPFRDIVKKIEETYGVDIVVKSTYLLAQKVSGSIRSPNLKIVLKGLAQTMNLNIERSNKKIIITQSKIKK